MSMLQGIAHLGKTVQVLAQKSESRRIEAESDYTQKSR